jgi:hypothetical protein
VTYTIGTDCHITLTHPDVNGGSAYGFLCDAQNNLVPEGFKIVREVITGVGTRVWIHFDVLLADGLINPDGSLHSDTRANMYAMLQLFLAETSDLMLTTFLGAISSLGALGFTADERHIAGMSVIKCQLNNVGFYYPPADPGVLALSLWDGTLTWETSYWR